MNRAEEKLILELCRFKNPDVKQIEYLCTRGIDQAVVLGQLMFHRVAGGAYAMLSEHGLLPLFHREFRTSLKAMYESACEKTEAYREFVDQLAEVLNGAKVPYALLKGGYLCHAYPCGYRTSNDVDVLLNSKDIDALSSALYANGFVQGHIKNQTLVPATRLELIQSRMTRGETVPFCKEISKPHMQFAEIDLNFSLHERDEQNGVVSELLTRRVAFNGQKASAYTLDKYDFVLHLCAHLYKEATVMAWVRMNRDLSLYKFLDIYMMLFDWNDEDFKNLLNVTFETYLESDVYYALYVTRELFGMTSMALDQALEYLELRCPGIELVLHRVKDPTSRQVFRYASTDLMKRLFSPYRSIDLIPDNLEKGSD